MLVVLCLWDYDTLKEEALGQPEVAAAVTGDLGKHSRAFYEAKIEYTRPLVDAGNAKAERYDDLAVAFAKVGKLDDAIATLARKDKRFPGAYTTEANLGTFLAMKGDMKGALDHLNKAIRINPDAHFGREKFQIQLLEYLEKVAKDPTLPERQNFLGIETGLRALEQKHRPIMTRATKRPRKSIPTAPVIALVGLIRFGDAHENPHVWAALAWALVDQGDLQLAIRAMRRAELHGFTKAAEQGGVIAAILRKVGGENPNDPVKNAAAWKKASKLADADWARGQAVQTRRQTAEDAKLSRKQYKAVFGY